MFFMRGCCFMHCIISCVTYFHDLSANQPTSQPVNQLRICFYSQEWGLSVYTHIYRVSKRLALIGPKVTADQAHDLLEKWVKPDRVLNFHVFLISHGREICKALRPLCYICPLNGQCPSREKLITKNDTRSVTKTLNYKPL